MQLTVWIQLDMGHRKEGHGLKLSFDLDLIPDFNLVTRMEIKYKCMDFESFLTFWHILVMTSFLTLQHEEFCTN